MSPITAGVARQRLLTAMRGHGWFTVEQLATTIEWPVPLVRELFRQLRTPEYGRHLIAVKPVGVRRYLYSLVDPQ